MGETTATSFAKTIIFAKAIDGSEVGTYVEIKAKWNSDTGAYELLTAGSGGGTTTPTTYYLTDTAGNQIVDTTTNTLIHNW